MHSDKDHFVSGPASVPLVPEFRKHSVNLLYDFRISLDSGIGDFVYNKIGEACGFLAFLAGEIRLFSCRMLKKTHNNIA